MYLASCVHIIQTSILGYSKQPCRCTQLHFSNILIMKGVHQQGISVEWGYVSFSVVSNVGMLCVYHQLTVFPAHPYDNYYIQRTNLNILMVICNNCQPLYPKAVTTDTQELQVTWKYSIYWYFSHLHSNNIQLHHLYDLFLLI